MKVAVFDTHEFDRAALAEANLGKHELIFLKASLDAQTAQLAKGCDVACCFANDRVDKGSLDVLKQLGVKLIALRSAGYNHVDIKCALDLKLKVVRVPEYSPHAVAEHAVGLLLTFNRKIHRAHNRVREMNFSLDGLVGFDLYKKTVGVVGSGKIGKVFAQIMKGFGCEVLVFDKYPDHDWAQKFDIHYSDLNNLFKQSDIISLHVPLNAETRHIIDGNAIESMKKNMVLINTGRGALIETNALTQALKTHRISGACLDVYEEEAGIFFNDFSDSGIDDDLLARLLTFPNVLITAHQAFLTQEALKNIADTTIDSISRFEANLDLSKVEVLI